MPGHWLPTLYGIQMASLLGCTSIPLGQIDKIGNFDSKGTRDVAREFCRIPAPAARFRAIQAILAPAPAPAARMRAYRRNPADPAYARGMRDSSSVDPSHTHVTYTIKQRKISAFERYITHILNDSNTPNARQSLILKIKPPMGRFTKLTTNVRLRHY